MKRAACLGFCTVILMLAFLSIPCYSVPVSLGSRNESGSGGMRSLDWHIDFTCGYVENQVIPVELLWWLDMGLADIGDTLHITPDMDPDFSIMSSLLTNGINDALTFGASFALPEVYDYDLAYEVAGGNNDFQGYDITSISLTANDFTFESPGRNPNGDGIWTDYSYDVTFEIWGVPEPATLLLLALGAVMLRRKG